MGLAYELNRWIGETGRVTRIENTWVNLLSTDEDKDPDMMQDDSRCVDCAYAEGYYLPEVPSNTEFFDLSSVQRYVLLGHPIRKGMP